MQKGMAVHTVKRAGHRTYRAKASSAFIICLRLTRVSREKIPIAQSREGKDFDTPRNPVVFAPELRRGTTRVLAARRFQKHSCRRDMTLWRGVLSKLLLSARVDAAQRLH